jgi:glycosyltransferase involved in cell wall biosynthesis
MKNSKSSFKKPASSNKKTLFSIVIPAYNEEKYLPSCLDSVKKQDFAKPFEIIVVDNKSTDSTVKIAKQFKTKLVKEPRKGLIYARNAGFLASRGKYIVNLDADCTVPNNWLSQIYRHFKNNDDVCLVTGPYVCLEKGQKKDWLNIFFAFFLNLYQKVFAEAFCYYGGNTAIKKSALVKIGGYDLNYPFDQISLLRRLKKAGGKTIFDKNIKGFSSPRRTTGRFWHWIFKEVLFLYIFNSLYIKITGKSLGLWEDIR